jgi:hypothetical protein
MLLLSFYIRYIWLPNPYKIPAHIHDNLKFYPFFEGCIGALDGTYIKASVPTADHPRYRSRKGFLAQNVLAACTFDGYFCYVLVGWEGSAADLHIINAARKVSFPIAEGSYFLADAGYSVCKGLLTPYHGVRYHLREWEKSEQR